MRKDTIQWLIPVLLALGVALALWLWWARTEQMEPVPEEEAPPPAEAPAPAEEPQHPLEPEPEPAAEEELEPLPPLEESDEYFRLELSDLFGQGLEESLVENEVIERVVATLDNLPRDQVAERIKPLSGVGGQFVVEGSEDADEFLLDPDNYRRYDQMVGLVENVDIDRAEEVYRRFYPLFQKAYTDLGYPDGYFNDRLVEVIDHLLETPDVDEPIRLVRPHVLYEYADPQLESLSPGQKLLLRIGSEHRATVKDRLRQFRERIAD